MANVLTKMASNLKSRYRDYQRNAEKRAQANLEKLRTKTAREKERAKLKSEISQARTATLKAETALRRAKIAKKNADRALGNPISDIIKGFKKTRKAIRRKGRR